MKRRARAGRLGGRALGGALLPAWLLAASPLNAQALFEIESAVWADGVDRQTNEYRGRLDHALSAREVFLWMRIRGSAELLAILRRSPGGALPVRHRWYRYDVDTLVPDHAVSVGIGRSADLDRLGYQVAAEGSFTWRYWISRTHLARGAWRVEIDLASGERIICPDSGESDSCGFEIEVR